MFCIGSSSSTSSSSLGQAEQCSLLQKAEVSGYPTLYIGGANNFCLQKSGMPLAGLVYFYLSFCVHNL